MARALRLLVAGGIYHVTARGNRRQPIFLDDVDRKYFLDLLDSVVRDFGWKCHAYCLMPNHYHLVIQTPEPNLSRGMHRLNFRYAQWFNWRHGVDGHLFQGRFHSVLVGSNWHLLELSRYVVLNPVRAGLAADAGAWPWSSYRAAVGAATTPRFLTITWLLDQFGTNPAEARAAYRRFVFDAPARASP